MKTSPTSPNAVLRENEILRQRIAELETHLNYWARAKNRLPSELGPWEMAPGQIQAAALDNDLILVATHKRALVRARQEFIGEIAGLATLLRGVVERLQKLAAGD